MVAPKEWRLRELGRGLTLPARKMAEAEGYIMARHKGCSPFLLPLSEWTALPACDHRGQLIADYE